MKYILFCEIKITFHTFLLYIFLRTYIDKADIKSLKLYITGIEESDAGVYTCQASYDNKIEYADISLGIYRKLFSLIFIQNLLCLPLLEIQLHGHK